jgi:hypothetical protein
MIIDVKVIYLFLPKFVVKIVVMLIALNSLNEKHTKPLILGQMIKYFPNLTKSLFIPK